jgi:uncharacterized protein
VARGPDGLLVLDPRGRMAGRGAYLCPSPACLQAAVKRRSFDRSFRQPVAKEQLAALGAELEEQVRALGNAPGDSPS